MFYAPTSYCTVALEKKKKKKKGATNDPLPKKQGFKPVDLTVDLIHRSQDCLQASNSESCSGCGSVIANSQSSHFYLPSTLRAKFYQPSSCSINILGKGQRRGGPGTRLAFTCRTCFVRVSHQTLTLQCERLVSRLG